MDDLTESIDFLPLDPHERPDQADLSWASHLIRGTGGRVLAFAIKERRLELEPPIALTEIKTA